MITRREALERAANGFGGMALAWLLGREQLAEQAELNGGLHHKAKVKRVIQLFMNGGVTQMDTFDYKPVLEKMHGKAPDSSRVDTPGQNWGEFMKPPFAFKQYGESGRWVSDVYPKLAGSVDDLAFLLATTARTNTHGPAGFPQNTGFILPGFPCMGLAA